mmetsp:Transcript_45485/g.96727  ORF Transcript_45485/g.96727 Transcript_45485/m.96727 type:complete len:437 (-) Transcript_45485:283-1593(-)
MLLLIWILSSKLKRSRDLVTLSGRTAALLPLQRVSHALSSASSSAAGLLSQTGEPLFINDREHVFVVSHARAALLEHVSLFGPREPFRGDEVGVLALLGRLLRRRDGGGGDAVVGLAPAFLGRLRRLHFRSLLLHFRLCLRLLLHCLCSLPFLLGRFRRFGRGIILYLCLLLLRLLFPLRLRLLLFRFYSLPLLLGRFWRFGRGLGRGVILRLILLYLVFLRRCRLLLHRMCFLPNLLGRFRSFGRRLGRVITLYLHLVLLRLLLRRFCSLPPLLRGFWRFGRRLNWGIILRLRLLFLYLLLLFLRRRSLLVAADCLFSLFLGRFRRLRVPRRRLRRLVDRTFPLLLRRFFRLLRYLVVLLLLVGGPLLLQRLGEVAARRRARLPLLLLRSVLLPITLFLLLRDFLPFLLRQPRDLLQLLRGFVVYRQGHAGGSFD